MWTKEEIVDRVYNRSWYKNYAAIYFRSWVDASPRGKRKMHRAPFENAALDNCMMDSALNLLTSEEDWILFELYGEGSGVILETDTWGEDAYRKVRETTNLSGKEIRDVLNGAFTKMLNYLNGGGQ